MTKAIDLRELMQGGFETARKIVRSGQEAVPVFLAQWGDGTIAIYATPFDGKASKDRICEILRLLFAARQVQRYAFIAEAWMVELPKDTKLETAPRPSTHPNRIEVLNLIGVEEGRVLGARAKLGKDAEGNRTCGDLEWWDDENAQGRMTELLPDPDWPAPPPGIAEALEAKFGLNPEKITIH